MAVPDEIMALVEMGPVEDLILDLLRNSIKSIPVQTLIEDEQTFPAIFLHRAAPWGNWQGDPRFLDSALVEVSVLCDGIEADTDAALIGEAVRTTLRDSVNRVVPNKGHVTKVVMLSPPKRVPDWDTATGPVQFADLPIEVVRYEAQYLIEIKKPLRLITLP